MDLSDRKNEKLKLTVRWPNGDTSFYTALILSANEKACTFKDKFNKTITLDATIIIAAESMEGEE